MNFWKVLEDRNIYRKDVGGSLRSSAHVSVARIRLRRARAWPQAETHDPQIIQELQMRFSDCLRWHSAGLHPTLLLPRISVWPKSGPRSAPIWCGMNEERHLQSAPLCYTAMDMRPRAVACRFSLILFPFWVGLQSPPRTRKQCPWFHLTVVYSNIRAGLYRERVSRHRTVARITALNYDL